jgi:hypothetical protein
MENRGNREIFNHGEWVWWNCCIEMDAAAKQFLEERSSMLKC